jgi:cation transport ATPase
MTVERGSEHTIARAIVAHVEETGRLRLNADDHHTLPGLGVQARIDGRNDPAGRATPAVRPRNRPARRPAGEGGPAYLGTRCRRTGSAARA